MNLNTNVQKFLEKYKGYLDDMRKITVLGRARLPRSEYIQLLIILHSCDISLPSNLIFPPDCDKWVISWQPNSIILKDFDDNLSANNLFLTNIIQDLEQLSVKEFIEYLNIILDIKVNPGFNYFLSDNKLKNSNNKLNPEIEYKAFINPITDNLNVLVNISDSERNTIVLKSNVNFGQYFPQVGYGWNSKRFTSLCDYLNKLISDSVQ